MMRAARDRTKTTDKIGAQLEFHTSAPEKVERRKLPRDTKWPQKQSVGTYQRQKETKQPNNHQIMTNNRAREGRVLTGGFIVLLMVCSATKNKVGASKKGYK